jgi:hypothetical protein
MPVGFDELTAHTAMIGAHIPEGMTTTLSEGTGTDFRTLVEFDEVLDRVLPAKRFGS